MLKEQGKRIPALNDYAQMLLPLSVEDDCCAINPFGAIADANPDLVYVVQTSPLHFRLMPGFEFSPRLYRGQNKFCDPCVPSIYRDKGPTEVNYWFAKWLELNFTLNEHPACLWLRDLEIEGLRFAFDIRGIAQHYEFPTPMLDFSRSKDVAMFFAMCSYDRTTNTYHPLKSGKAVLYTIDLQKMILENGSQSNLLPLGLEPLPRPEAQKAFAVQLLPTDNLNKKSWVRSVTFNITERESDKYYELFDGGRALFPPNPFDEHIRSLRVNRTISKNIIEIGIQRGWLPLREGGIDATASELHSAGYTVTDHPLTIDPAAIMATAREWETRKSAFQSRIRLRGVSDHAASARVV